MIVTILTDIPDSWILPWAENLQTILMVTGAHQVNRVTDAKDILPGDVAFFLGCTKIVAKEILARNKFNMVPHPSNLPKGKGFSPLAWQILEGNNEISMTLFDAVEELDAGDIYLEETMHFDESELNDEIKNK